MMTDKFLARWVLLLEKIERDAKTKKENKK
jgi:hypothetical protein